MLRSRTTYSKVRCWHSRCACRKGRLNINLIWGKATYCTYIIPSWKKGWNASRQLESGRFVIILFLIIAMGYWFLLVPENTEFWAGINIKAMWIFISNENTVCMKYLCPYEKRKICWHCAHWLQSVVPVSRCCSGNRERWASPPVICHPVMAKVDKGKRKSNLP